MVYKIAVGTQNKAKLKAVADWAERVFKDKIGDFEVVGVEADPGVSRMPMTVDEMRTGARNRAIDAMSKVEGANVGIGLEGGVETLDEVMYLSGWAAIVDENDMVGLGSAGHVEMPADIAEELKNGAELGNLMAKIHERDVRNNDGTFGILTDGYISRSEAFEYALTCAFTKYISAAHE